METFSNYMNQMANLIVKRMFEIIPRTCHGSWKFCMVSLNQVPVSVTEEMLIRQQQFIRSCNTTIISYSIVFFWESQPDILFSMGFCETKNETVCHQSPMFYKITCGSKTGLCIQLLSPVRVSCIPTTQLPIFQISDGFQGKNGTKLATWLTK